MRYQALEVRSDGTVTAQVIIEEGDDKNEVYQETLAWCREKLNESQPPAPPINLEQQKAEIERQTKREILDKLYAELNIDGNPTSPLVEEAIKEPEKLYNESAQMDNPQGNII